MKRRNLVVAAVVIGIALVCSSCIITVAHPITGNGRVVTSARAVSAFEKIHISGSAKVRFHESQEYQVSVTVDSNLDEYTEVYVNGNVLNIKPKNGFTCSFTKLLVDVYCPVVTGVSVSGSGHFEGIDTIITPVFTVDISGSGKIGGTFECGTFSAKIAGSGKITAGGNSKHSNFSISGSGSFFGDTLSVNTAVVKISGSGNAYVNVTDSLKADISGSGAIYYRGNPQVDSKISGSGRVKKI